MGTKIEWAEETWNPIIGCSKVSLGCDNCYAEKMATRLAAIAIKHVRPGLEYPKVIFGRKWNGQTHLVESALEKPFKWKKPRTIFVCSMGDLFHESVPFEWIDKVIDVITECPQHTFLLLTKRPEVLKQYSEYNMDEAIPNIWLGVTAENQEQADKRIPILLNIPAAKRFVSIEPMLGPIDLQKRIIVTGAGMKIYNSFSWIEKLDWIICGGESGSGARPIHPAWVRSLQGQCKEADIPFMFKQWGEWHPNHHSISRPDLNYEQKDLLFKDGMAMCRVGKKKAGRELDGKIWNQKPES